MLIKSLAAGPKYVDELGTLICRESESIRCHVVDEFQQHRKSLADSDYIKRFLDSLWFPEIQHRQEIIKDAHVQTFRWIYGVDGNTESAPQWDDFAEWLERGEGTYWINGKPGSGKSTLMNYIYQEKRTYDLLKAWSGEKELLVPSFFFWKAGIDMEQSIIGLLRSLLYQILAKFPDKIRLLDQMNSPCEHAHPSTHGYKPIAAWTEHRLQTTFDDVMHQMQDSCRMCIFIDGLDEFTGDQSALVETLVTMQSKAIKLCLSSRPHRSYNEAFGSYAKLKLQDLTDGDIKTFVSYKLQAWLRSVPVKDVNMIFDSIVNKAEGVFLWVELVVKDLLRGLGNNDSLDQLVERVRILPSGIEELYAHMLSDIDGIYKKEAAGLFHMAIVGLTRSLLDVSLAIYKAFDKLDELTVKDAICFCELTKERIPTVCAGLLEIYSDEETWSLEHESTMFRRKIYLSLPSQCHLSHNMAKISSYERSHHLEFLHRTALDFLRESEPGKRFMTANTPLGWNPYEPYVKALLAKVSLLGFPKCHTDMKMDLRHPEEVIPEEVSQSVYVGEIMHKVVLAERYNGTAQIALCEHVDRTLTIAHQQTFGRSVDMHWYTQWGYEYGTTSEKSGERDDLKISRPSSRSSLAQSYHSAKSEQANTDLESLATRPVDFLGLACYWSLVHYVQHALDSRPEHCNRHNANYLLCCCMRAACQHYIYGRPVLPLPLIRRLLGQGANPNLYVRERSMTVWGIFLRHVRLFSSVDLSAYSETAKVFIENGADIHISVQTRNHDLRLEGMKALKEPIELDTWGHIYFRFYEEEGALFVMRNYLANASDFKALEIQCLSRGFPSVSSIRRITLIEGEGYNRRYRVKLDQYAEFEAAVEDYQRLYNSPKLRSSCLEYAGQLVRLWKEITNDAEDSILQYTSKGAYEN